MKHGKSEQLGDNTRTYYIISSVTQIVIWGFILRPKDMSDWSLVLLVFGMLLSLSCFVLKNMTLLLTSISQSLLLVFLSINIVMGVHPMSRLGSLIIFTILFSSLFLDLINAGYLKFRSRF